MINGDRWINSIKKEINTIKSEMHEMKSLLIKLVEKEDGR